MEQTCHRWVSTPCQAIQAIILSALDFYHNLHPSSFPNPAIKKQQQKNLPKSIPDMEAKVIFLKQKFECAILLKTFHSPTLNLKAQI